MIEIDHLVKRYGSFTAVRDVSFDVAPGEIFGFLGVNGAGKTTTLRMLAGILKPTSGSARICGHDISLESSAAKRLTGFIPDRPHVYPKLSGREFLRFVADLYSVDRSRADRKISELLEIFTLVDWQHELIEGYSHGMKQRLSTCAALVHDPKVLIVDEPMVGLDPHGAKLLKDQFRGFAKNGMSILLSTHSLNVAQEVADRLAIIQRGSILTTGTFEEIKARSGSRDNDLEKLFLELTAYVPDGVH